MTELGRLLEDVGPAPSPETLERIVRRARHLRRRRNRAITAASTVVAFAVIGAGVLAFGPSRATTTTASPAFGTERHRPASLVSRHVGKISVQAYLAPSSPLHVGGLSTSAASAAAIGRSPDRKGSCHPNGSLDLTLSIGGRTRRIVVPAVTQAGSARTDFEVVDASVVRSLRRRPTVVVVAEVSSGIAAVKARFGDGTMDTAPTHAGWAVLVDSRASPRLPASGERITLTAVRPGRHPPVTAVVVGEPALVVRPPCTGRPAPAHRSGP